MLEAPEAAKKALDFLPYRGQRTKPPDSLLLLPKLSAKSMTAGEFMSLKSKHHLGSPEFASRSSTPTDVTFNLCRKMEFKIMLKC